MRMEYIFVYSSISDVETLVPSVTVSETKVWEVRSNPSCLGPGALTRVSWWIKNEHTARGTKKGQSHRHSWKLGPGVTTWNLSGRFIRHSMGRGGKREGVASLSQTFLQGAVPIVNIPEEEAAVGGLCTHTGQFFTNAHTQTP